MKQNAQRKISIVGLFVLVLSMCTCGKAGDNQNRQVAEKLLKSLNEQLQGSKFKTDVKKSIVKPTGKNRYRVTFTDSYFTTDLAWIMGPVLKYLPGKANAFPAVDTAHIEEVTGLYDLEKDLFDAHSLKGMSLNFDFRKYLKDRKSSQAEDFEIEEVRIRIGKMSFKDEKSSDNTNLWNRGFQGMLRDTLTGILMPPAGSAIESLEFEAKGITKKKDNLSILLKIEKIANVEEGAAASEILVYLFKKGAPRPDLSKILQKKLAIMDSQVKLGKVKAVIKKNGKKFGEGVLDSISLALYARPGKSGVFFEVGGSFGIKKLGISIPNKKNLELLSQVEELGFNISIEELKPDDMLAIFILFKEIIDLRDLSDAANNQEFFFRVLPLLTNIVNSKVLMKVSLSPCKHYFGELEIQAEIRLHGFPTTPGINITVTFFKLEETLKKLRASDILSPVELAKIKQTLDNVTTKKENGDARLEWEIRPGQPGKYYLNGKPKTLRLY